MADIPVNPFNPTPDEDSLPLVPFVGRQRVFERLYQQLTDPVKVETPVILGQRQVGKTALLRHFDPLFDETFISVYVPLRHMPIDDEAAWLKALADRTTAALVERGFTTTRLPDAPADSGGSRAWFETDFLAEALNIIRRHRRLVYLFDDADTLLRAIEREALPADTFAFWRHLLEQHRQASAVLTLNADAEAAAARLSPLAALPGIVRLTHLTPDETAALLRQPVSALYAVSDEAAAAIYRAAGGQPRLVQRFGAHLFRRYAAAPQHNLMAADDVRAITPAVYEESEGDLKLLWESLPASERLALTGVTGLLYADPLTPITARDIESWLIETDFPQDSTTVHAALRSLEYREIISGAPVQITIGLMQTWLLDNARQVRPAPPAASADAAPRRDRRLVIVALVVLALVVLAILSIVRTPGGTSEFAPQPTVTLITTPAAPP